MMSSLLYSGVGLIHSRLLLVAQTEPGLMVGGGKWPSRFHARCSVIVGELEDESEEVYTQFRRLNIIAAALDGSDAQREFSNWLCSPAVESPAKGRAQLRDCPSQAHHDEL